MLFIFFFKQKTAYDMRISDWSSDVCYSDLLAHIRRQQCHAERRSVALGQDRAQHGFEIVDVPVHLLTEIGIGVVDRDDLARLGGVEQAHRAPCEDSAIALQIRGPGAVRYLVRERLGDRKSTRLNSSH